MIEKQYVGKTFIQITHRLRINRGPGRPDKVSERPRAGSAKQGWGRYLDTEKEPPLITFDEHDQVDVDALLLIGAIMPYEPAIEEVIDDVR